MSAIIGAIIFASLFLLLVVQQSNLVASTQGHATESSYIQDQVSQVAQFYAASLKYLSGFGVPANNVYITVADLQQEGLLPGAFPAYTPFGMQLQGWPVADPSNPTITDLTVISAAPQTSDAADMGIELSALKSAGFGTFTVRDVPAGIISEIDDSVEAALTPALLTQYTGPLSSAQAQSVNIGHGVASQGNLAIQTGEGTTLVADTGIPASTLPAYQASAPAIEVIAPNQLGYTLISYSISIIGSTTGEYLWANAPTGGVIAGTSQNEATLAALFHLSDLGWSPVCPSGATDLTPTTSASTSLNKFVNEAGTIASTELFCLQSYRSEKVNIQNTYLPSSDFEAADYYNSPYYSINGGAGAPMTCSGGNCFTPGLQTYTFSRAGSPLNSNNGNPQGFSYQVNGSPYSLTGLPYVNEGLVAGGPSFSGQGPYYDQSTQTHYYPPLTQNTFWNQTISVQFSNIGVNFSVLQPQGATGTQVNTYQFLLGAYQLPTGTGVTWGDLGLPVPSSSDPNSGYTGQAAWSSQYSLWSGNCVGQNSGNTCIPNGASPDSNVLSGASVYMNALGTSDVTDGYYLQITPMANTGSGGSTSGGAVSNLPYTYTHNGAQTTEDFSATIPSTAMCNINYATGQSGNCP